MTISPTTFEADLRGRLLDIVYGQWHDFGAPFADVHASDEVIDPEALLWCSLEFLPTEPRLCETVVAWLHLNPNYILRQRLKNRIHAADPRLVAWRMIGRTAGSSPSSVDPSGPPDSYEGFADRISRLQSMDSRIGKPVVGPSTLLMRARDLLGGDGRHLLLVYLLANPGGARLRDIQRWTGYSYRSTSETATRWQSAFVVDIDHGYCRLIDSQPWRDLLKQRPERIVLVDFFNLFEACIQLMRSLGKARKKGIDSVNSPVIHALLRDANTAISSSRLSEIRDGAASINYLQALFPKERVGASRVQPA